jgi:hypothetical protein
MGTNKQVYVVLILRRDLNHITVLETENYDSAFELWTSLKDKWPEKLKEQKPFELTKPIVSAFDPGLISEIKIETYTIQESVAHNPYTQEMQKNGLSSTLSKLKTSDLLDRGYKID